MLRIALLFIPFYAARRSLRRFADGLRAVDFFKAVAVIFGVGLLSAAWAESPDIAGRVQFVVGEVSAADRDGAARALGKRDAIFEGDTVTTGPSASAQIMMIDGARIAVRPNSAFMVNEYRAPSADDVGASILTLLKGGFRTLSGLIGEESARYRIDTPCCAIGLRGTDHAVFHIPAGEEDAYGGGEAGTYNKVYEGATFLESAGVTLDITPQTDAGFAARGQPPVFVPDIPETAEGAIVLAPSEESESEDESENETETADADDSNSESDDAVLAESPADESSSALETAETVEIAIEFAAPPIADLQNPADIADALQRENTMLQPEPIAPIFLTVVDASGIRGDFEPDAPHAQEHEVVLGWRAVPGFDSASSYRVYRDGVRAEGEFNHEIEISNDMGNTMVTRTINNRIVPLSFSIDSCDADGCLLDSGAICSPADACRAAVENVPGTSFIFRDRGLLELLDAEGRIIFLFDGGVSHTYEIRAIDENGVETLVGDPITFTAPAVVDNNLEDFDFAFREIFASREIVSGEEVINVNAFSPVNEVNHYLPVLDAVMPSEFVIGNRGILASQTNVDVISDDRVFSYSDQVNFDFEASTYDEGTIPDLVGYEFNVDDQPRVYVYRFGDLNPALTSRGAGIEEFTFSYAIEAGAVTRLTDYDVLIRPSGERWEFGLADGSRVDLTHAETFFDVAGTADLGLDVPGDSGPIDGIASFGSNNERIFSRFGVGGGGFSLVSVDGEVDRGSFLSGRFDIPATMPQPDPVGPITMPPQPDPVGPILLAVVDGSEGDILDDAPHVQGHEVALAWSAVPGFDSASSYRVYRDGVRADGQFIDDRGTRSLTIDNGIVPFSFSIDSCNADGCSLDNSILFFPRRAVCSPADACRAAVENAPGTLFLFGDFGLFDAESGRIIGLFDGGVSHTYEIRVVDENGVETRVVGPIALTAPAVVNNNLENFVLPEINANIVADNAILGEVNEYLPVLDAVMPSDFIIGSGGILASQTDVDVISDDRVFLYSDLDDELSDFRVSTYEGTTPDLGNLLGTNDQPRVYVYRFGDLNPALTSRGAGIEEFTFSYAIEAGAVTRLTDYDVLIRPSGERWEFGLADGSRVDLTHAETFFEVAGTAVSDVNVPGVDGSIDGIASFGSNNERVFSRFSVEGGGALLRGRFDIPAGGNSQ